MRAVMAVDRGLSAPASNWLRLIVSGASLLLLTTALAAQTPGRASEPQYPPSSPEAVAAMLKLAAVTKSDVVYDLGSGDGRIPIAAAHTYGARAVGIEINPALVKEARDKAQAESVGDRVRFIQQDLFEADIREATVVTLFLLTRLNQQLMPKLKRELRPGTRVVSHQFRMDDTWPPEESQDVNGLTIYLWTIK